MAGPHGRPLTRSQEKRNIMEITIIETGTTGSLFSAPLAEAAPETNASTSEPNGRRPSTTATVGHCLLGKDGGNTVRYG